LVIFNIWKARNNFIFNGILPDAEETWRAALQDFGATSRALSCKYGTLDELWKIYPPSVNNKDLV
jgi:hypothetical protein